MTKARDLANAGTALTSVSATELGYVDGVTSAIQTQIDSKEPTLPSQTGNSGKYLTTNGTTKSWGTVSQYSLPSQTGNSGKFLTTNGTSESWGTVNQPTTWTGRYASNQSIAKFHYANSLYVAVGSSGTVLTSTDAITWTSRTSGFGANTINDVIYVPGLSLWIIVGDNGTLATSSDAITWTLRTANMSTNQINNITYNGTTVVAVGRGGGATNTGGIIYSTDGTTWTRKNQSLSVGANYNSVIYNDTNWLVGSTDSGNNYIYASTPSGTWTAAQSGSGSVIAFIAWDGTRTWAVDANAISYSTGATYGTSTSINNTGTTTSNESTHKSTRLYNGRIYTVGAAGFMANYGTTISNTNYLANQVKEIVPGGNTDTSVSSQLLFSGGRLLFSNDIIWTSF